MLLALAIVAFVVIIARYVPWVNLLCFTEAIYHVVKIYETNEAPLIIAVSKPSNSALPIVKSVALRVRYSSSQSVKSFN